MNGDSLLVSPSRKQKTSTNDQEGIAIDNNQMLEHRDYQCIGKYLNTTLTTIFINVNMYIIL